MAGETLTRSLPAEVEVRSAVPGVSTVIRHGTLLHPASHTPAWQSVASALLIVAVLLVPYLSAGPPGSLQPARLPVRLAFVAGPASPVRSAAHAHPAGGSPPPVRGAYNLGSIPVKDTPTVASYDSRDGYLYVTNFGSPAFGGNTVSIIADHNSTVVATVPVGDDPLSTAYDPTTGYDYVLNFGTTNNLSVFNGTRNFASVKTGQSPYSALYDPANTYMYISNQASGNISIVNGTSIVASPVVGLFPGIATFDPTNQFVYVPNTGSNNVSILNGTAVVANVSAGNSPTQAVYDPADGWVYVVNSLSNNITILNGTKFVASISGGGGPNRDGYDPANGDVYVADTATNTVLVLNGTKQVANLSVGLFPRNIVYDAATQEVFVPDWTSNAVTVINGTTVVATVSVGIEPFSGTYDPGTAKVYIVNFNTANVSVLGDPANASNVTFQEHGLPSATTWGARVGPTSFTANVSSITFPEPNGSYNYSVLPVHAFAPLARAGAFSVSGTAIQVNITFVTAFPITFHETGLGPGEYWNVTIPPDWNGSVNATNVLWEPNGSYSFTVRPVAGYVANWTGQVNVTGGPVSVNVTFVQVLYPVTFHETGLTPGTLWGARIGTNTSRSTNSTAVVSEPNGSYIYQILPEIGYIPMIATGPVSVNGSGSGVSVTFTRTFPVTFLEHGLPSGPIWSIAIGLVSGNTSANSLAFAEPNGSYGYSVATNAVGYHANSTHGTFDVQGGAVNVTVNFSANATGPQNYTVIFEAGGLPANVAWTVHFGAQTNSTTGLEHDFAAPNGSYNYTVSASGYSATPSMGNLVIAGPGSYATPIRIEFQPVQSTPPPRNYTVSFAEQGLPTGTSWAVEVNSTDVRGTGASLAFQERNGTHAYRILGPVPGFATTWSGQFLVAGANRTVGILFHPFLYEVQFTETGLSSGTTWNVTLGVAWNATTSSTASFPEPNGTYAYSVASVSGYSGSASGTVVVNGSAPAAIGVEFHPNPKGTSTLFGIPIVEALGAIGVLALVAIVVAVLALRKRGRSPPPEPTPETDEPTPRESDLEP